MRPASAPGSDRDVPIAVGSAPALGLRNAPALPNHLGQPAGLAIAPARRDHGGCKTAALQVSRTRGPRAIGIGARLSTFNRLPLQAVSSRPWASSQYDCSPHCTTPATGAKETANSFSATHTAKTTAHHHRGLALLLAGLSAIGPFSLDAYLPSLYEIGQRFSVSTAVVQQTLTAFMVPFAAMTLWQGAISDALGRRRVVLTMLAIFCAASLGCMCAWSIGSLMAFRALQGMTAGAGMVIGRAVVRDVLEGTEARRLMAHVSIMFALAPSAAPVIGGWLHVWFGWRSVFAFMAFFAAVMWIGCWRGMPETLPPAKRLPLQVKPLLLGYWHALSSRPFAALVLALTLNFCGLFVYIVSAPAFVINHLKHTETDLIWLFAPVTCGILGGTYISARLAGRLSNRRTVVLAYSIMGSAALTNVAFHALHAPVLPWSIVPLVFYCVGNSMAFPSLTLLALDLFPTRRGLASSCQSFTQSSGNALVTALLAPVVWGTTLSLSLTMIALLGCGLACYVVYLFVATEGTESKAAPSHPPGR